jgi:hypothetical protein
LLARRIVENYDGAPPSSRRRLSGRSGLTNCPDALKDKGSSHAFYLDDAAQVMFDEAGNERPLTAESYATIAKHFDRIARADAWAEKAEADMGFQSCLKGARAKHFTVRLARGAARPLQAPAAPGAARFAPTGPTRDVIPIANDGSPTYCQQAAMGLYEAVQYYNAMRLAYFVATGVSFGSGITLADGVLTYDALAPLAPVGAIAFELAAADLTNSLTMLGVWADFFTLGGCWTPGAQYGYYDVPVPDPTGGGGTTSTLSCTVEDVALEISYDDGGSWSTFWSGTAVVCE